MLGEHYTYEPEEDNVYQISYSFEDFNVIETLLLVITARSQQGLFTIIDIDDLKIGLINYVMFSIIIEKIKKANMNWLLNYLYLLLLLFFSRFKFFNYLFSRIITWNYFTSR